MEENNEKKEDLGFSKGGFETLNSGFGQSDFKGFAEKDEEEKNDSGSAWYERNNSEPAWYESPIFSEKDQKKPEHRPHPMLEEHALHEHSFPDSIKSKSQKPKKQAPEREIKKEEPPFTQAPPVRPKLPVAPDGRIYLPNPPPKFLTDTILDPNKYIEEKFKTDKSLPSVGKKNKNALIVLAIFAFVFFVSNAFSITILSVLMLLCCMVSFFVFIAISAKEKTTGDEWFLIKPHAMKIEDSMGNPIGFGNGGSSSFTRASTKTAIRFYYSASGNYIRECVTEKFYTQAQACILAEAFRKGTLVVACKMKKISLVNDIAVICSPNLP